MVRTPSKPLTLEEFLKLPETTPASEYTDGQIIQKPMRAWFNPTNRRAIAQGAVAKPIALLCLEI